MNSLACFKVEFISAINQELSNQSECRRSYQIIVGERQNKDRSYTRCIQQQTSRFQVLQNSQSANIYTSQRALLIVNEKKRKKENSIFDVSVKFQLPLIFVLSQEIQQGIDAPRKGKT
jgi:hypothetical protein